MSDNGNVDVKRFSKDITVGPKERARTLDVPRHGVQQ